MNAIIPEYLNYIKELCGFAARTVTRHKRICGIWKAFLNRKARRIIDVAPQDLLDFIEYRSNRVKRSTLVGELCVIRSLYAYLYDFKNMDSNPAASLPELISEPPDETPWLTADECFRFLDGSDLSDPIRLRNYTITALLWSAGLRNSELCALNQCDIDLEQGALRVRKGKGGKQRQIFFNDRLKQDLIRYQALTGDGPDDPVFRAWSENGSGKPEHSRLSTSRPVEIIREHRKAPGMQKAVSPLTFRHTFATHMSEAHVPVRAIKQMPGHDEDTETMIYIHISIDCI